MGTDQDPGEIFRQNLAAAAAAGADVFEQFFGSVDLGDPEAIREAALAMIEAWRQGTIGIEDLEGLTREEWEAILRSGLDAADALEEFGDSARQATLEMSNVPRGFRQAALAFGAQDPTVAMKRLDLPLVIIARAGSDGDELPRLVAAVEKLRAGTQNITVHVSVVSKTDEQLLEEIIEAAERKGAAGGVTFSIRKG